MNVLYQRLILAALLTAAACPLARAEDSQPIARADRGASSSPDDPAEATNRQIFEVNQSIDRHVLKPVATSYEEDLPQGVREGTHNFVTNIEAPNIFVNDLLQGNLTRAATTTGRFLVNSTAGAAGFFDVANAIGLRGHEADFGQTFGVWGVDSGPSVQIPLFGPSNVRDSIGFVVGFVADPLGYVSGTTVTIIRAASGGAGVVDGRARVLAATDALEESSIDYYSALRSASAQHREALVEEGRAGKP
jgi:phospholipid-binding lipoprotein MlaA